MADLGAVEIPLVVREQGLKESLRTVNRLEGEIRRAVAAANAQQISQDRLNKTLLNAKREYQDLGVSSQKATAVVRQFAAAARDQQAAVMGTTKGMNSMGVGMQQLGYQVGDFLVQIQSGTNAFVAFGQQATQVVGFLPMMTKSFMGLSGTALVAFSAGLGIVIPLVTALGATIMRTADSGRSLDEVIGDLSSSMNDYRKSVENSDKATENMLETYGRITPQIIELEERLQALQLRQVALDAQAAANAIADFDFGGALLGGELDDIRVTFDTTIDRARVLQRAIEAVGQAEGPEATLAAIQALGEEAIDAAGGVENLTEDQIAFINELTKTESLYQQLLTVLGIIPPVVSEAADNAERLRDAMRDSVTASSGLAQQVSTLRARLAEARGEQGAVLANTLAQMEAEAELRNQQRIAAGVSENTSRVILAIDRQRIEQIGELTTQIEAETEANKGRAGSIRQVAEESSNLTDVLDGPLNTAIGSVSDAWADFVMRGFRDFSSFKDAIVNSFKNMIAQMIAIAARNRIMINLGMAGGGGGGLLGGGNIIGQGINMLGGGGGDLLGSLMGGGNYLLGGTGGFTGAFGSGLAASLTGGISGGAGAFTTGLSMIGSGGGAGLAGASMALGAIAPLGVAALALGGLFGRKKKPVITQEQFDALADAAEMTGQNLNQLVRDLQGVDEGTVTLTRATQQLIKDMAEAAGGVEEFTKKAQFFYMNFYTEGERQQRAMAEATRDLNKEFEELGIAIPETHAEFRKLVEAQDLTTQAGRDMYTSLLNAAEAFVAVKGSADQAAAARAAEIQAERAAERAREERIRENMASARGVIDESIQEQMQFNRGMLDIRDVLNDYANVVNELNLSESEMSRVLSEAFDSVVSTVRETSEFQAELLLIYQDVSLGSDRIAQMEREAKAAGMSVKEMFGALGTLARVSEMTDLRRTIHALKRAARRTNEYGEGMVRVMQELNRFATRVDSVVSTGFAELQSSLFGTATPFEAAYDTMDQVAQVVDGSRQFLEYAYYAMTAGVRGINYTGAFDRLIGGDIAGITAGGPSGFATAPAEGEFGELFQRYLDIKTVVQDFTTAIGQAIAEPMQQSLDLYLPSVLNSLEGATRTRVLEILKTVQEGDIASFEQSVARLSTAYGQGQISSSVFQDVYRTLRDVFQGNLSLTEEYTTKQAEILQKLNPAFNDFTSRLEGLLDVVQGGLDNLRAIARGAAGEFSTRQAATSYLRNIAGSGEITDMARFRSAVETISSGSTAGFSTQAEFLRYVSSSTSLLEDLQRTFEAELETPQIQQVKALLNIQETNETAAEALSSINSLMAEFLGAEGRVPAFASGGYHSGGMRLVGERGPELEVTGPARIYNAQQTRQMLSGADTRAELAEMRRDLNNGLAAIAKYTRKSADTLNKFDYQGLPQDRGY